MVRRLVLMGSGETTPTMVTPHQRLLGLLDRDTPAVLVDTPYGFQENADELTARTQQYFAERVGRPIGVASLRRAADGTGAEALAQEQGLAAVRAAGWVFSGPGSPSYALRQWAAMPFADLLRAKLTDGGVVVLSSAAAVTAGRHAIPVYEIYKAGEDPHWLDGLDLTAALGLDVVVIPHFDNAEGGTHDTRFCYLGQRRLRVLEERLAATTWVLGVDEHTAAVIDPATGRVEVIGRGGLHVRARDLTATFATGITTSLDELQATAEGAATAALRAGGEGAAPEAGEAAVEVPATLAEELERLTAAFDTAMEEQRGADATAAALELEALLRAWLADPDQNDLADRGAAALRSMITRLGDAAAAGMHDHESLVRPHIETLVHVREEARKSRNWEVADHIRAHMARDGVELRDSEEGTDWVWEPDRRP